MKIFKFRQVDAKTGISVAIEKPKEGPTNPSLPGLVEVFDFNNYRYANVDDTATEDPENFIFEITEEEFTADVESKVNQYVEMWEGQLYENEKALRTQEFGKYADNATSSGIYKYEEALKYLDTGVASVELTAEATARGVDVEAIADRIIANHQAFRLKEAKIAGLRGKILDRLNAYAFDATDALGSWKELVERKEVIGQRPDGEDVEVGYYTPELSTRWMYMS